MRWFDPDRPRGGAVWCRDRVARPTGLSRRSVPSAPSTAQILLSILCGLQFPLAVLPDGLKAVGRAVPLTHFIDLVRAVVISGDRVGDHAASVAYLVGSGFVMLAVGAAAFELVRQSVRRSGLVTGY